MFIIKTGGKAMAKKAKKKNKTKGTVLTIILTALGIVFRKMFFVR